MAYNINIRSKPHKKKSRKYYYQKIKKAERKQPIKYTD